MHIGWIGAGKMGLPMSGHLVAKGHTVYVYDPSEAARAAAAALGARPLDRVAAAAGEAEVAISMIPNDKALLTVALGPDGVLANLPPGAIFCDMSTVSPETCEAVRAEAERRGIAYVAAPVSGSTATAQAAALTVMASGPAAAVETLRPLFGAVGKAVFHVGEGTEARYLKLAVNHLIGSTAQLVAEALTLGRKGGVAWGTLLNVLGASAAASPLIQYKLDPLRRRDFAPAFSVAQMAKDMGLVAAAAQAAGVPAPLADAVSGCFADLAGGSLADEDFFAVVKDVERRAGLGEP